MDIGNRIRQIRIDKGISQRHVQKKLGKYGSWLSQVEGGSVQIYAKDVPLLADALGVEIGDLFVEEIKGA
ncbi:MAG: helix-turn-helix transcriptional regulator [Sporomusaceae bacterium]|nr:helix-turn-helix transcriptional regulator [Sporomusaceae bacterium]